MRHVYALLALAGPSVALAAPPRLSVSGTCPGPITLIAEESPRAVR